MKNQVSFDLVHNLHQILNPPGWLNKTLLLAFSEHWTGSLVAFIRERPDSSKRLGLGRIDHLTAYMYHCRIPIANSQHGLSVCWTENSRTNQARFHHIGVYETRCVPRSLHPAYYLRYAALDNQGKAFARSTRRASENMTDEAVLGLGCALEYLKSDHRTALVDLFANRTKNQPV